MAKIFVKGKDEDTQVPFLRGILIRSLQDSGLSFENAYDLATDIRNELSEVTLITTRELRQRVLELLKGRTNRDVVLRYSKLKRPFATWVEQRDGQVTTFSRVEFQNCLETIGITSEEAQDVVATIYRHLVDRHIERITSRHLADLTYRYLRQTSQRCATAGPRSFDWRRYR